jgi:hypothetical protein
VYGLGLPVPQAVAVSLLAVGRSAIAGFLARAPARGGPGRCRWISAVRLKQGFAILLGAMGVFVIIESILGW